MPGIANAWTKNKNYKDLIHSMNLQDIDESYIIDYYADKAFGGL